MLVYKVIFLTELLLSETLFCFRLKRRNYFALRLVASLAVMYTVAWFFPVIFNAAYMSFLFLLIFALTLLAAFFCFEERFFNILFCGIAAYTVQHIAFVINCMINRAAGLSSLNPYTADGMAGEKFSWWSVFIYFWAYAFVYWIAYFKLSVKIKRGNGLRLGNIYYLVAAGLIVLIDIVLNMVAIYNTDADAVSVWLEWVYNIITCLLALWIQFSRLSQKETEAELEFMNSFMKSKEIQYERSKVNTEAINAQVHDLKHFINAMRAGGEPISEAKTVEMEKLVSLYESVAKTGNGSLDVVISEKVYYCANNGITLTYIADGKLLGFMEASDIYVLFGNALDNAIEAVLPLNESMRNISFSVKSCGNMISVHVENYFSGELKMKNGLPLTSKADKSRHGFGTLSIKTITEKYGGTLSCEVVGNVFNLNIIFIRQGG